MKKKYLKYLYLFIPIILCLFIPWQVVLLVGIIFSLFAYTHLKYNNLKFETFDITPQIKDPLIPMSWYRDEIISQMSVMRWALVEDGPEWKVWAPLGQARVMEDSFSMSYSPYIITIKGSRNMVTMMKSFLDLEKIFL